MGLFAWSPKMSVGVGHLDEDHKKLMALANKLYSSIKNKASAEKLNALFLKIIMHLKKHHRHEEELLEKTAYPLLAAHKAEHVMRMEKITALYKEFEVKKDGLLTMDLMIILCKWWQQHIETDDKAYQKHLNDHGIF